MQQLAAIEDQSVGLRLDLSDQFVAIAVPVMIARLGHPVFALVLGQSGIVGGFACGRDRFEPGAAMAIEGGPATFRAEQVLAKHDETYMPPEVNDALEKAQKMGLQ